MRGKPLLCAGLEIQLLKNAFSLLLTEFYINCVYLLHLMQADFSKKKSFGGVTLAVITPHTATNVKVLSSDPMRTWCYSGARFSGLGFVFWWLKNKDEVPDQALAPNFTCTAKTEI